MQQGRNLCRHEVRYLRLKPLAPQAALFNTLFDDPMARGFPITVHHVWLFKAISRADCSLFICILRSSIPLPHVLVSYLIVVQQDLGSRICLVLLCAASVCNSIWYNAGGRIAVR